MSAPTKYNTASRPHTCPSSLERRGELRQWRAVSTPTVPVRDEELPETERNGQTCAQILRRRLLGRGLQLKERGEDTVGLFWGVGQLVHAPTVY